MTKSKTRSAALRDTPSSIDTLTVSEFVRGKIYDVKTPTMIISHGTELGTWLPRGYGVAAAYYANSNTVDPLAAASSTTLLASSSPSTPPVNVEGLNSAIDQLHEYLSRLPKAAEEEK